MEQVQYTWKMYIIKEIHPEKGTAVRPKRHLGTDLETIGNTGTLLGFGVAPAVEHDFFIYIFLGSLILIFLACFLLRGLYLGVG